MDITRQKENIRMMRRGGTGGEFSFFMVTGEDGGGFGEGKKYIQETAR